MVAYVLDITSIYHLTSQQGDILSGHYLLEVMLYVVDATYTENKLYGTGEHLFTTPVSAL